PGDGLRFQEIQEVNRALGPAEREHLGFAVFFDKVAVLDAYFAEGSVRDEGGAQPLKELEPFVVKVRDEAARIRIAILVVHPETGGFVETFAFGRPETGTYNHPRQWVAEREVMVDILRHGLVVGIPGQCAERLPPHAEEFVLRFEYRISELIAG